MNNQEDTGSNPVAPAKIQCPHCDRSFSSQRSVNFHIVRIHIPGKPAWNKGLTKECDARIKRQSQTQKERLASGQNIMWQTGKTKETDPRIARAAQNLSKTVNQKIDEGTWHRSFAHRRKHSYKNETFDGTWEFQLAQWFDKQEILWVRNKTSFPYRFENKERRYTPDFYLPEIDCYVEVKGWKTLKDEAKWAQFPHKLQILSGVDLQNLGIPITVKKDWKHFV